MNGLQVLEKIYKLLPAIGNPKITGNLGSLQNIINDNREVLLAEAKLSDPFKPAPMTMFVLNSNPVVIGGTIDHSLAVRIQFGVGGINYDTGFNLVTSGFSTSVCASWIRLSARIQNIFGIAGAALPIQGSISLGSISRTHAPLQTNILIATPAGATTPIAGMPLFARALRISTFPDVPFDLVLNTNNIASYGPGEKTGWIPVSSEITAQVTNNGVVASDIRFSYDIEF